MHGALWRTRTLQVQQRIGFCVHSASTAHLREALAVEGFALTDEEMARLSAYALEPLV